MPSATARTSASGRTSNPDRATGGASSSYTPPTITISGVTLSGLGVNGVTISWQTTGIPTTTRVEYGTTTALGTQTTLTNTPAATNGVVSHNVALSGLTPGTTYYYRVESGDGTTTATSDLASFATPALATPGLSGMSLFGFNAGSGVLGDYAETDGSITSPIKATFNEIYVDVRFTRAAASDLVTDTPSLCLRFKKSSEPDQAWDAINGGWRHHMSDADAPAGVKGRLPRLESTADQHWAGALLGLDSGTSYDLEGTVRDGAESQVWTATVSTPADAIPTPADLRATATKYYVDWANGNDANDGSSGTPWKSLAKALGSATVAGAVPTGGVLVLKDGIHPTNVQTTGGSIRTNAIKIVGEHDCVAARNGTTREIDLITTAHAVVASQLFSAPTGSPSTDPLGVYSDATLASWGSGVARWEQISVTGPKNGQTYTLYRWNNIDPRVTRDSSLLSLKSLVYGSNRYGRFTRMMLWDVTTAYSSADYETPLHNLGAAHFAEIIAESPTVNPHCGIILTDPDNSGKRAIYLLWDRAEDPNTYWWEAGMPGDSAGVLLRGGDSQVSQVHFRSMAYGVDIGSTSGNNSGASGVVVDSCWFDITNASVRVASAGGAPNAGRNGWFPEDIVVQNSRLTDSGHRADDLVVRSDLIPWVWTKEYILRDPTYWDYLGYPGKKIGATSYARLGRLGGQAESSAFALRNGGGARRVVFRFNHVDGLFNGFTLTGTTASRHYGECAVGHDNLFEKLVDDNFEPEHKKNLTVFRDNWARNTMNPFSVAALRSGTHYFVRNTSWETGVHGMGQFKDPAYEAVASNISLDSSVKNRFDGGAANNFMKVGAQSTGETSALYLVHNTHWTSRGNKPGVYGEEQPTTGPNDSGATDPSGLPTFPFRYVRNNVFRVTGYAARWGSTHGLYTDEDHNVYVCDGTLGVRINSGGTATYPQKLFTSTAATGTGSPEEYRTFAASRPNRPDYAATAQATNLLADGSTLPFVGSEATLDALFVDAAGGDLTPVDVPAGLVGAGQAVCNLSDTLGTAPSIGAVEP